MFCHHFRNNYAIPIKITYALHACSEVSSFMQFYCNYSSFLLALPPLSSFPFFAGSSKSSFSLFLCFSSIFISLSLSIAFARSPPTLSFRLCPFLSFASIQCYPAPLLTLLFSSFRFFYYMEIKGTISSLLELCVHSMRGGSE